MRKEKNKDPFSTLEVELLYNKTVLYFNINMLEKLYFFYILIFNSLIYIHLQI